MHAPYTHSKFFRRGSLVLLTVVLLGCAIAARRAAAPATTQAVVTSRPRQLDFAAAVPVEKFRDDDHDVDLRNVISFDEKRGDVYFGQCDEAGDGNETLSTVPLVVAQQKGAWVALSG